MATRRSNAPADGQPPPRPRRGAARKGPAPAPQAPAERGEGEAQQGASLWQAGLKALDTVRQDAARRHASVIESLLGIAPVRRVVEEAAAPHGVFPGLDPFGLRKFEDVFDQRVAAALERLGMPTRDELQALRAQLDAVLAQLERLGAAPPAGPPAATAAGKPAKEPPAARRAPRTTGR
ncbi:phasin family protein [Xenophilus sp.]|uniref:phasin family protein n=1 Tax=Xenophilus sp. TaxID=1873499 RepID=UPI0037DC12B3